MNSGTLRVVTSIVNREDVTWKDMLVGVIQRTLTYNFIELVFVAGYLISYHYLNTIHPAALWFGFALTVAWILSTSVDHAAEYARHMVLHNELFLIDFVSGVVILSSLAWIVRHEDWQFPVMFGLAALQHLRYSYLSASWLIAQQEMKDDKDTKD